jgi:hypothetical protein
MCTTNYNELIFIIIIINYYMIIIIFKDHNIIF